MRSYFTRIFWLVNACLMRKSSFDGEVRDSCLARVEPQLANIDEVGVGLEDPEVLPVEIALIKASVGVRSLGALRVLAHVWIVADCVVEVGEAACGVRHMEDCSHWEALGHFYSQPLTSLRRCCCAAAPFLLAGKVSIDDVGCGMAGVFERTERSCGAVYEDDGRRDCLSVRS